MPDTILLQVVSPDRQLVEEQVTDVQVPALDGFIGVLPGHAKLLSMLKPGGLLSYHVGGQEKSLVVYGGFVEVLPDRVRVLADSAEFREEINSQEAKRQLDDAMNALQSPPGAAIDPAVAIDEMFRAQARVEAAEKK
jgi:F-type H+-transporting ATPase subunit epsilon